MQSLYRYLPAVVALALSSNLPPALAQNPAPPLVLAEHYYATTDLSRYWVSEKYDGARVWWDGAKLISRGGSVYRAPYWFTANFPKQPLDGELWIGRNEFQLLMQTIRDQVPDDAAWRSVKFMVFDAPLAEGSFNDRQKILAEHLSTVPDTWVKQVPQVRISSHAELQSRLEQITADGGEGLMLQREDLHYLSGRHHGLLKFKLHTDAEAKVVAHIQGKGKYSKMLGSLLVEDSTGVQFKIGSGFTDYERQTPPAIGSQVTYRYQGRTKSGKPRFARYLRVRED